MSQQKEKLHPHLVPDNPWSKVAVDYYSNVWEVDRMESSTTATAVISMLKQHFARHGIPTK